MKAGRLDRRLMIRKRVVDSGGPWGDVTSWPEWREVAARLEHVNEDEAFAANELYTVRIVTFETRYLPGVDNQDRLECEGQFYDILGIREIGRREGLEIKAQWRPDNADGSA